MNQSNIQVETKPVQFFDRQDLNPHLQQRGFMKRTSMQSASYYDCPQGSIDQKSGKRGNRTEPSSRGVG